MKVYCKSAIICLFIVGCSRALNSEDNFDQAIKELQQLKPELFVEKTEAPTSKATIYDDSTYEKLDKSIDIIAVLSALIRIYHRHHRLNTTSKDATTLNKIFNYALPSWIKPLGAKLILVKDASIITVETITYKTVAKLLLYCAKGDACDLAKKLLCKIKTIILW